MVNQTGKSVQDVVVRESCRHYSAEFKDHEADLYADSQGNKLQVEQWIAQGMRPAWPSP